MTSALYSAWWFTLTLPRSYLKVKGQGHTPTFMVTWKKNSQAENIFGYAYTSHYEERQRHGQLKRGSEFETVYRVFFVLKWSVRPREKAVSFFVKLTTAGACSYKLALVSAWTLLTSNTKILESFHMKCQRHILGIRWYDRIHNTEIDERSGLAPLMDLIIRRRNSLFGQRD